MNDTNNRVLRLATDVGDLVLTIERAQMLRKELNSFLGPEPATQTMIEAGRKATWLGWTNWVTGDIDGIVKRVWQAMQEAR